MPKSPSILIVCTHYPPDPVVGALRAGGLAAHLGALGWKVQVLTTPRATDPEDPSVFPGLRDPTITRPWRRSTKAPRPTATTPPTASSPTQDRLLPLRRWTGHHLKVIGLLGDRFASRRLHIEGLTRPDLVYATAPGWSGAVAGRRLADRWNTPFVAEFRDIWADNIYIEPYFLSTRLDRSLEAWVVRGSRRVVCVTSTAQAVLQRRYPSTTVLHNPVGFDPVLLDRTAPEPQHDGPFRVVHAGWLYDGKRDPSPLFEALARLRDAGAWPERGLAVDFYGGDSAGVLPIAERFGVSDVVHAHGQVSREAARAATQAADIQLVILNADPRETTAIPAKAYEMLPSPQPTLCIGPDGNPTREVLGRKSVSHYGQDAKGIAEWLASRFQASGWPPAADVSDLTHSAVIERLSEHLHDVLMEGPNP